MNTEICKTPKFSFYLPAIVCLEKKVISKWTENYWQHLYQSVDCKRNRDIEYQNNLTNENSPLQTLTQKKPRTRGKTIQNTKNFIKCLFKKTLPQYANISFEWVTLKNINEQNMKGCERELSRSEMKENREINLSNNDSTEIVVPRKNRFS